MKISVIVVLTISFWYKVEAQEAFAAEKGQLLYSGYDPVTYFTLGSAIKGNLTNTVDFNGRKISFSSPDTRELFLSNPDKYLPAYGGWCAIAMVDQLFVIPDYTMFKIQDGQLLFFQVKGFVNGKTLWEKNPGKNKLKADMNYHSLFPD